MNGMWNFPKPRLIWKPSKKQLMKSGEMFGINSMYGIKKSLRELAKHLEGAKFFESVKDKTERMVRERVVPGYMIRYYKK